MNNTQCHSCLKSNQDGFCLACRKNLFDGKKTSPVLPFSKPEYNQRKREQAGRLSISGVQSKYSLRLNGTNLEMTESSGQYILKPYVESTYENMQDMQANEHLTMQLAKQVFGINTAESALVYFKDDNQPAYLTKRFDVRADGGKNAQEDFAQITGATETGEGSNYKYNSSYEKITQEIKRHVSIYKIEMEKFYKLTLFNYLIHNGDAHVKNFSLYRDPVLDSYKLTPAYDLLNTRLHIPEETFMALDLFENDYETEAFKTLGFYSFADFLEFGKKNEIKESRVKKITESFIEKEDEAIDLIEKSFLSDETKALYITQFRDRINPLIS
jgi:serine/threonine-protein kinase HipA